MTGQAGMVITDGRVLLASDLETTDYSALAVIPREIRVGGQTLRSDERANVIRSLTREATNRQRGVQVLPPKREHFLPIYQASGRQHKELVSIHLLNAFDGAFNEALICRQLMQPSNYIHVYEAKTLEGGLEFVIKTALALASEGANTTQLLALLRYLESHMLTFLITPGQLQQPWAVMNTAQRARSVWPGTETLWFFDPKLRQVQAIAQAAHLHAQLGPLLKQRWGALRYSSVVRYRGYTAADIEALRGSLIDGGLEESPRVEPVAATFMPGLPRQFIELLFLPTDADLRRLRGVVQDPIWWKGAV